MAKKVTKKKAGEKPGEAPGGSSSGGSSLGRSGQKGKGGGSVGAGATGRAARAAKRESDPMPGPLALDPTVRALENLRRLRARPEPRREVGEAIAPEVVRLKSAKAALGGLDEEWERVVPRELRERCWARGVSRRVLTVATEDASAMYQLSMWLRGGGEQELRAATKQQVSRVKIEVVGEADRR
ncbi:MAG: DUF721 domain-containing protein [Phycisphaeraceae bacterium]|nr:MAG: DUF721 domain-containing protein [Phycisphaeraceae bacterium]